MARKLRSALPRGACPTGAADGRGYLPAGGRWPRVFACGRPTAAGICLLRGLREVGRDLCGEAPLGGRRPLVFACGLGYGA